MKKILSILLFLFFLFSFDLVFWAKDCEYSSGSSISDNLDYCLNNSELVKWWDDAQIWSWFDWFVKKITNSVSLFLSILSVFGIVYGSAMLVFSAWEDEKINKAKTTVKWSIIWFLAIILASTIINILVKVIYSI